MKNVTTLLLIAFAVGFVGCSDDNKLRLVDGRVFSPEVVHNEKKRVHFEANGWVYNLPSFMVYTGQRDAPIEVTRVEISRGSIVTPDGRLAAFQDLMQYLDKNATRATPVILVMNDVASWPKGLRRNFGRAFGEVQSRPFVGAEGPLSEE